MFTISMTAMTLVCLGVNLRLAIEIHSWTKFEYAFMWFSIFAIELACLLFSYVRRLAPIRSPRSALARRC